jgi:hypothetical protein
MKRLLILLTIFLLGCGPSIQEKEETDMVNEIDQLVATEKARADALIKNETKDASTNTPKP